MSLVTILLTGVGLAMDAVAVSVSSGMALVAPRRRNALKMALWFGAFQALMRAVGFLVGIASRQWVAAFDHWIAFALLSIIGARMIREALVTDGNDAPRPDPFSSKQLAVLAVATSIDALAVGVSFSLLDTGLVPSMAIIGLTTFALCYPAALLGRQLGELFSKRAELAGGLVLIAIGTKVLVEHTLLA
jgi:putative Mn2+ efflux pump MntP